MLFARTIAIVVTALAAHGGALALDAAEADRLVKRYLATQKTPDMDAQAQQQIVADLNGDGKPEIVLLWSLLGPTYWYTKLSVLVPAGKAAQASVADITGLAETLRVDGGAIVVDTLVLGKNDPRCCPSVKKKVRYRWSGTKLALG